MEEGRKEGWEEGRKEGKRAVDSYYVLLALPCASRVLPISSSELCDPNLLLSRSYSCFSCKDTEALRASD